MPSQNTWLHKTIQIANRRFPIISCLTLGHHCAVKKKENNMNSYNSIHHTTFSWKPQILFSIIHPHSWWSMATWLMSAANPKNVWRLLHGHITVAAMKEQIDRNLLSHNSIDRRLDWTQNVSVHLCVGKINNIQTAVECQIDQCSIRMSACPEKWTEYLLFFFFFLSSVCHSAWSQTWISVMKNK